jgi:hypothetical protein
MRLMKALMTIPPRFSLVRVALLAGALLACAAPSAHAAAWPGYGGDPGRSGNQPVDAGVVPLAPVWQRTAAGDQNVKTSIVTSAGSPATQRVIYGTSDGVVHFRRLSDGVPFGGADVGGDADVFGTQSATPGANGASVSFADTSTATGPGQLFAAHNDGAGIEIAHFNEADGSLVDEFAVPGTTGMTIESSLLATPAGADGGRSLFFVAGGRLFKVPVANAGTPAASFGAVTRTADVDANPIASPTLLYLDVVGTPMAHIAIGTTDGFLRTYRTTNLAPGPFSDLKVQLGPGGPVIAATDVMTASVPVQPDGMPPGPGSAVQEAQFVYVAAYGVFPPFSNPDPDIDDPTVDDTIAYKLHVVDGAFEFQFEFLPIPDTRPAPALSVSQVAEPDPEDAEVLITTTTNLFLATTRDMDLTGEIDFDSDLVAGVDGFQQTTAATSGPLYYVTNDRGEQTVGRLSDGKTVAADDFTRDAANAGADNGGVGQPAISRGYVQFAGPDGVFVYRNSDVTPPAVALTAPAADATVSGTVTVAATASDSRGISQVEFRANGRSLGTDTTAAGDSFSVSVDTNAMPAGEYVLDAIATDAGSVDDRLTTLSEPRRVVVRSRGEDAPPTVEFTRPAAGALLSGRPTLSANASDDHGVASVRFLAGERVVCTDTTAPYECDYRLGADDVGRTTLVAVATDTAGQTGAALRTVRVSRFTPAFVSASTAPRRDRRRPFRFTTSGRVRLPSGLTRAQACGSGDVAVVVKAARKTISTRRVQLSRTCSYRSRVTFRPRNRFPRNRRLTVRVRFLGNAVLGPRRAEAVAVGTR